MPTSRKWIPKAIAVGLLIAGPAIAGDRVEHVIPSMTNAATLTWQWQPQYRVEPSIAGQGAISGLPGNWVDEGPITLDAVPDTYHQFDGWSGDTNTTANPLTIHVDRPITKLTANFVPMLTARGTPHEWLARFGLTPDDDDRMMDDNYTVWQHYIADTNPTNPASFFPPLLLDTLPTGFVLTIDPTSTNRLYHIDSRTNLLGTGWTPATNAPGTGGPWTYEIPLTGDSPRFYRSRVTLP